MKAKGLFRIACVWATLLLCTVPAAPGISAAPVRRVDLQGLGEGYSDADYNSCDWDCIRIMDDCGTWGENVDRLIPHMTAAGVESVVAIYLERHLFPGVTADPEYVLPVIGGALERMTEENRNKVADIVASCPALN